MAHRFPLLAFVVAAVAVVQSAAGQSSLRVIDGDTVEVAGERIRLEGIDAPERGQVCKDALGHTYDCGAAAVRVLVDLTNGQTVSCDPVGKDRYGRTLAVCKLASGLGINAELVRRGVAVAFRRYSERYVAEEDQALGCGLANLSIPGAIAPSAEAGRVSTSCQQRDRGLHHDRRAKIRG